MPQVLCRTVPLQGRVISGRPRAMLSARRHAGGSNAARTAPDFGRCRSCVRLSLPVVVGREGRAAQVLVERSTRLDKIKNLHSPDTIDTQHSGTRGRSIWMRLGSQIDSSGPAMRGRAWQVTDRWEWPTPSSTTYRLTRLFQVVRCYCFGSLIDAREQGFTGHVD